MSSPRTPGAPLVPDPQVVVDALRLMAERKYDEGDETRWWAKHDADEMFHHAEWALPHAEAIAEMWQGREELYAQAKKNLFGPNGYAVREPKVQELIAAARFVAIGEDEFLMGLNRLRAALDALGGPGR